MAWKHTVFLLANNFEKKKNKTEGDPDQHKLKELSDTNNPVEEQETAMDNSKWSKIV